MQISLDTALAETDELTALIALCASLGGRLPGTRFNVTVDTAPAREKLTNEDRRVAEHAEINQGRRGPPLGMAEITGEDDDQFDTEDGPEQAVDSNGTPWDGRIHSESRAINADGTWRKRRGVSDQLFAEVMAELTDAAPPPPPADEGNAQASSEDVPAPPAPTADAPSESTPAASAPVAGEPAGSGQFASFADFVAAVSKHGKTYAELNEMAGVLGVPAFKDLKDHADKWDMFFGMIG